MFFTVFSYMVTHCIESKSLCLIRATTECCLTTYEELLKLVCLVDTVMPFESWMRLLSRGSPKNIVSLI